TVPTSQLPSQICVHPCSSVVQQNLFHPRRVLGRIHAHTVVTHPHDSDLSPVFQRSQLLEFLRGFKRRNRKLHQPQQGLPPVTVNAQMFQKRKRRQLFD